MLISRYFATDLPRDSREFAALEDDFYASLITSNGSWKTTAHHRLDAVNAMFFDVIARTRFKPAVVMDIGISSGISTLEWLAEFDRRGLVVEMVATDRTLTAQLFELRPFACILMEPNGHCLNVELLGQDITLSKSLRYYLLGVHFAKHAIVALARSSWAKTRTVSLVVPSLARRQEVRLIEDDILAPNALTMVAAADVIRLANLVQRGYFSDDQIRTIARNIKERCRAGGMIILCRNHPDSIEASLLRRQPDGQFTVEARLGEGSEVESFFVESGGPA